jgi:hypothetical protein
VDRPAEMVTQLYPGIEVKASAQSCFQQIVDTQASAAGCNSFSIGGEQSPFDPEADCFVS